MLQDYVSCYELLVTSIVWWGGMEGGLYEGDVRGVIYMRRVM